MIRSVKYVWHREESFDVKKSGDVGYDMPALVARDNMTFIDRLVSRLFFGGAPVQIIWPFMTRVVHTGLRVSMPGDVWSSIRPRSSTMKKKLIVLGGTIDSGYHGEYLALMYNIGFTPRAIRDGHRYAQVVFHPAVRVNTKLISGYEFATLAAKSERGTSGFGSTGQ